jgi:hypothetical protein
MRAFGRLRLIIDDEQVALTNGVAAIMRKKRVKSALDSF